MPDKTNRAVAGSGTGMAMMLPEDMESPPEKIPTKPIE
jgi:hypothetical protein